MIAPKPLHNAFARSAVRRRRRRSARGFWRMWLPRLDLREPGGPGVRERLAAVRWPGEEVPWMP